MRSHIMQKHKVLSLGPQNQLSTLPVLLSLCAALLSALPRQKSWRGCAYGRYQGHGPEGPCLHKPLTQQGR